MRRIFVTLLLMLSIVAATVTARTVQTAASNAPTALAFLQNVNSTLHYTAAESVNTIRVYPLGEPSYDRDAPAGFTLQNGCFQLFGVGYDWIDGASVGCSNESIIEILN